MSRPDARALAFDRRAIGSVAATITSGQSRPARSTTRTSQVGPLVRRQLADVDGVGPGHADGGERPRRRRASAAMSTGFGITSTRAAASSGARARRSAAMRRLTAMTAPARASPRRFAARFARMYGIIGSAAGPERARRAAARIASCCPTVQAGHSVAGRRRRAMQVGPVADRPVVAHGDDRRHAGRRGRARSTRHPSSRAARG